MRRNQQVLLAILWLAVTFVFGIVLVAAQEATPEATPEGEGEATAEATIEGIMGDAAIAHLFDAEGNEAGHVNFVEREDGKVVITVIAMNLPPGFHGFHVHQTGACDPAGEMPFQSAGGHFNPTEAAHPDHVGDLPTLLINADGAGELLAVTDRFKIADLFDDDGSAMIVHANPNNFANIPERYGGPDEETLNAGDSGARLACGVIERNEEQDLTEGTEEPGESDMTAEATAES